MKVWFLVLVSLIDDVLIVAVVILALWYFKVKLPWWAIILITLSLGAFIFVRTWFVVPSFRQKKVTGAEAMIGMECQVVESLVPLGVVKVCGELWKAKSISGDVAAGEEVEVLCLLNRLCLEVKRKDQ